jgi:hypothetical protein
VLLNKFCAVLWEFIVHAPGSKESDITLSALVLIDLSLTGNLILIVRSPAKRISSPRSIRPTIRTGRNG